MATKKQLKSDLNLLLKSCRLNRVLQQNSLEYTEALALVSHMPIVYGQRETPDSLVQFKVSEVHSQRFPSFLCLFVFKVNTEQWVPLTAAMIFRPGCGSCNGKNKRVVAALRLVVKSQINSFRAGVKLPIECPLTGMILNTKDSSLTHVDHHLVPFSHLLRVWMAREGLTVETIDLNRQGDIKDKAVARSFYDYHLEMADLRLVDKAANIAKGAKLLPIAISNRI